MNIDNINVSEIEIERYLTEEGLLKQKIEDETANFHYIIEYPLNNNMDLIQPKGKNDLIIVGCATEISQEQLPMIKSANAKVRKEFIWDIRFGINNFLLDFELYHPNDILEKFIISDQLYTDGLTKDRLMTMLKTIFKAKLYCIWMLDKTFSGNATKDSMFV